MNTSPLPPLAGLAVSGSPIVAAKAPGSPESVFTDALSAILSGILPQPIVPVPGPNPVAINVGAPTSPLSSEPRATPIIGNGGLGANLGTNDLNALSGTLPSDLELPLLDADLLAQSVLPRSSASPLDLTEDSKLSGIQTATLETARPAPTTSRIDLAMGQQSLTDALNSPPTSSLPAIGTNRPAESIAAVAEASATSTIASAKAAEPPININFRLPQDQRARQSVQQRSLAQQPIGQAEESPRIQPTASTQVTSKDVELTDNTASLTPSKPSVPAATPNFTAAEIIGSSSGTSPEPIDIFYPEVGRLDPVGASNSKPSVPSAQPPHAQIALQIARAIPQGVDRFSLQLHPADLGAIEIQLDISEDGRVSAMITAERPETLDMLQRDSRTLERSLNGTGLQLENDGLSFSLKQEQHQHGQGFNASSHQQSRAYGSDRTGNDGQDSLFEREPVHSSQQRLLDIRT